MKKGEKAIRVQTMLPVWKEDKDTGEKAQVGTRPGTAYLFALPQVERRSPPANGQDGLVIIDADDATMTVECEDCGDVYLVERRERTNRPLFAEQIAAEQPTPAERITAQEEDQRRHWQAMRNHRARVWRSARAIAHSLPSEERETLLTAWDTSSIPGQAAYFADYVRRFLMDA